MDTNLTKEERQHHWFTNGLHYGYPMCCIKNFLRMNFPHEEGPWIGTGYIACPKCAPEARKNFKKFVAEHITPNRKEPRPFPHDQHNAGLHPEWPE
jgi:hypothetical protein